MHGESAMMEKSVSGSLVGQRKLDITMGENIDAQIKRAEDRLQELLETKQRLEATGLLTARLDDLQRAMQY